MIPFRLRKDAKAWFKYLLHKKAFSIDFDVYYFCAIAGLAELRKSDATTDRTTELIDHFPKLYAEKSRILIALFLSRELKWLKIDLSEKESVRKEIRRLVAPISPSQLSTDAVLELNKYASGGFDALSEWLEDPPRALSTFLPLYKRRLDVALKETISRGNTETPIPESGSLLHVDFGSSLGAI